MKRFHVHLRVEDLDASIAFYSRLFAAEPTRREADYAKWMVDDPRLNFAISARGGEKGIDHLGLQAEGAQELAELRDRAQSAGMALLDEGETTCCYARSAKHWVTDPQGIAWEQFHTLGNMPLYGEEPQPALPAASQAASSSDKACCVGRPAAPAPACC